MPLAIVTITVLVVVALIAGIICFDGRSMRAARRRHIDALDLSMVGPEPGAGGELITAPIAVRWPGRAALAVEGLVRKC